MAMPKFNNNQLIAQFQDFRQKIYNCFSSCSDACMDLLDALAGNTEANSIAELSLSPLFPRSYNSIYKRGCPKKYGERFNLADVETWHSPDETTRIHQTTRKGRMSKHHHTRLASNVDEGNQAPKNVLSSFYSAQNSCD
ncbi:hypothetical protein LC612_31575 [Nostoc sp. CHAB 5834]|nr:hypothetical protein [Nostoc sp. CHAB 5834]